MASISRSDTGVRLGCSVAFPPTAMLVGGAGTSDLGIEMFRASDPEAADKVSLPS